MHHTYTNIENDVIVCQQYSFSFLNIKKITRLHEKSCSQITFTIFSIWAGHDAHSVIRTILRKALTESDVL